MIEWKIVQFPRKSLLKSSAARPTSTQLAAGFLPPPCTPQGTNVKITGLSKNPNTLPFTNLSINTKHNDSLNINQLSTSLTNNTNKFAYLLNNENNDLITKQPSLTSPLIHIPFNKPLPNTHGQQAHRKNPSTHTSSGPCSIIGGTR